jgi:uncharacterized membrane protein
MGRHVVTAFTAWKFETVDGAAHAVDALTEAQADGLLTIVDHAVVTWQPGAEKAELHHAHDDKWRGTGLGALWGFLAGALFFVPVLGAVAGAAVGAVAKSVSALGLDEQQLQMLRKEITPGTSALFVVTENADLDRVAERLHGLHWRLMSTNLTAAERSSLLEAIG